MFPSSWQVSCPWPLHQGVPQQHEITRGLTREEETGLHLCRILLCSVLHDTEDAAVQAPRLFLQTAAISSSSRQLCTSRDRHSASQCAAGLHHQSCCFTELSAIYREGQAAASPFPPVQEAWPIQLILQMWLNSQQAPQQSWKGEPRNVGLPTRFLHHSLRAIRTHQTIMFWASWDSIGSWVLQQELCLTWH